MRTLMCVFAIDVMFFHFRPPDGECSKGSFTSTTVRMSAYNDMFRRETTMWNGGAFESEVQVRVNAWFAHICSSTGVCSCTDMFVLSEKRNVLVFPHLHLSLFVSVFYVCVCVCLWSVCVCVYIYIYVYIDR